MRYVRRVRRIARDQQRPCDPAAKKPIAIGIDPSLTGTAVVVLGAGTIEWSHCWTTKQTLQRKHQNLLSFYKTPDHAGHADRVARVSLMADWVLNSIKDWVTTPDYEVYAAIEGLAMSQRSNRASDLAELSGAIKVGLFRLGVPFRIYDPLTLKLAWTGDGHAEKSLMIMTCYQRWRLDYTKLGSAGENFADATLLAHLLDLELGLRDGRKDWKKDLNATLRKVLQRKTKAEPVPLRTRPFIDAGAVAAKDPVLGSA